MRKVKLIGSSLLFVFFGVITIHSAMKQARFLERDIPTLLNFYYNYKEKNPLKAKKALELILKQDPSNPSANKLYQSITTPEIPPKKPIYPSSFIEPFQLPFGSMPPPLAPQEKQREAFNIGYIYAAQKNNHQSVHFCSLAAKTTSPKLKKKAELAMPPMGSSQFQALSKPFFAELYAAPFHLSRFDLGVLPTIARAGLTLNEQHPTDLYLSWRRTKDNRSGTIQDLIIQNSISQIFEDDFAIYAAGLRTYLWPKLPLQTFVEIGQAEDLVYRTRSTWRNDVRGGLVYYNAWGEQPTWTAKLTFPWKWVSTLYADTIYYSRYQNNIIGTTWFRPGLRVATFQSASLDIYVANYVILDKNKEFYNNVYVVGPGLVFQPSNRLNVLFRLESLQGYYIPVNSPTPNPYRSKYSNNLAMVEVYFRL